MKGHIFIGGIHPSVDRREIERIFERYGKMNRCELKKGYAFVDYEDFRDAEDAIFREHGRLIGGTKVIVEWAKGTPGYESSGRRDRRSRRNGDDYYSRDRDYSRKRYSQRKYSDDGSSDRRGYRRSKRSRRSPSSRSSSRSKSASRSPSIRSASRSSNYSE